MEELRARGVVSAAGILRHAFLATYEDADNALHIEDYQVLNVESRDPEESATSRCESAYMQLPSVTVEKTTLMQHWHRDRGRVDARDGRALDPASSTAVKPRGIRRPSKVPDPSQDQGATRG